MTEEKSIMQNQSSKNPIRKGQVVDFKIKDFKFPNVGIGYASEVLVPSDFIEKTKSGIDKPSVGCPEDKRRVLVKNAFPGQTVRARISKNRDDRVEANLLEVVERADYEIEPRCKHFNDCGGCMLQMMPYEKQLKMKEESVLNLFKGAGVSDFQYDGIVPSPKSFEYRNKMELSFGNEFKGGETTLGMHKRNRYYDIINIDGCQLMNEDFRKITSFTLDYVTSKELPHYNRASHEGYLRHLVIRRGENTGEIVVAINVSDQMDHDFSDYVRTLRESSCLGGELKLSGNVVGVLLVTTKGKGDAVSGDYEVLFGRDYYFEELMGLTFKVSLYSFFQTNTLCAERLYNKALDYTGEIGGKVVYDLFSGTGTIGQIAAMEAKEVVGAEIVGDAVKAAIANARLNGITNARFLTGDVFDVLSKATEGTLSCEEYGDNISIPAPDAIIVDPPRSGISDKTLERILGYGVPEITYVSCNPKSLLDNIILAEKLGYRFVKMSLVDQFPMTGHVECVVKLEKR